MEHAGPEIEFVQDSRIPGAVHLIGRSAVQEWLGSFQETWESFQIALQRIESTGDERVLMVGRITAKGRGSGVEVDQTVGHVLTFSRGQMVRWDSYADADDALRATGLSG